MLTEVRLYGHLGERFGKVHHFAVHSAAQAIRALEVNLPGFRRYMVENSEPGYYVIAGKNEGLSPDELGVHRGLSVLKIVPGVQGRKAAGGFQMILGAVLIAIGAVIQIYSGGTATAASMFFYKVGAAMFLGGLSAYLAPQPKLDDKTKADQPKSYAFDGPVNTMAQGGPVPVLYGMLGVGSTVAAMAIYAEDTTFTYGGGGGPGDDPTSAGFHIWTPSIETYIDLVPGQDKLWPLTVIEAVNGSGGYTYTVEDDSGTFKLSDDGRHLAVVATDGMIEVGSYTVNLTCEDSSGDTCEKVCSIRVEFEGDGGHGSGLDR